MAMSNGRPDLMTGPCQNMMQAVFGGLDAAALSFDPVVRSAAQANLEAFGLASRRAQAYLEVPARLAQCRTPQDLLAEQMRFWQTAMAQYQDSSRKMVALWGQAVPELPIGKADKAARKPARDYIMVPPQADPDDRRRAA